MIFLFSASPTFKCHSNRHPTLCTPSQLPSVSERDGKSRKGGWKFLSLIMLHIFVRFRKSGAWNGAGMKKLVWCHSFGLVCVRLFTNGRRECISVWFCVFTIGTGSFSGAGGGGGLLGGCERKFVLGNCLSFRKNAFST